MTDREQLIEIARMAAKETVAETFRALGIDVEDPFAMQRDMAHLRFWRKAVEGFLMKFVILAIGVLVTFVAIVSAGSRLKF